MRLAGTCRQYSKKAMAQLARIAFHSGESRNLRCPYQAQVMKMFEPISSNTVRIAALALCRSRAMVGEHAGDDLGDLLAGRDMEEFVGAVCIGMRAEHAGYDELRGREARAEHCHKRNAAAFADIGGRRAERFVRRLCQRGFEPWRQRRRIPAR